jgi:hypothetical protein
MEWDLSISQDPGSAVGVYLALLNGSIDGSTFYLGLQTDIANPALGHGVGKGLILSTWSSFDASDTRLAGDGFLELGTHEGRFVGVRRPYEWRAGDYRVRLARASAESDATSTDWFELSIQPLATTRSSSRRLEPAGDAVWIGALRFRRRAPERPATIDVGGLMFLEVYSGAQRWSELPTWQVAVMAYGKGERCPRGVIEYPRPYGRAVSNTSAHYDGTREMIELQLGLGEGTASPAREWP